MSFGPRDNLLHIIAEADFLLHESHGLTSDEFQTNEILRRAFVRSLGDATKRLPREYRAQHPSIEWHRIAATRDRLIHDYFGVDYELVWDVVQTRIPELRRPLASLL